MQWGKICLLTSFIVLLLSSTNEYLLKKAGHHTSIVDDQVQWSIERRRVKQLDDQAVVLLGASRMQTNFDITIFEKLFPKRSVVQLAISGGGSALPTLQDIVNKTSYKGTLLISETEYTLIDEGGMQQDYVDFFHHGFSIDKYWNKKIDNSLLQKFLFLNPNGSSERIWGNLIIEKELPEPMYINTLHDRQQLSYFFKTDTSWLWNMRMNGIENDSASTFQTPETWIVKIKKQWQTSIKKFTKRGGKIIFVRMPVDQKRWSYENKKIPLEKYWNLFISELEVSGIHFSEHEELKKFRLPDTSHLDWEDREEFTKHLVSLINF